MHRRNLQFNALRAFEAAVSHQLRLLEQDLGVRLFRRTNRGLQITPEGERLAPVLVASFDRIAAAIDALQFR
jgi:DNA-binding transcriptional LysR family regulator